VKPLLRHPAQLRVNAFQQTLAGARFAASSGLHQLRDIAHAMSGS
jgi:hypothetical protein